MNYRERLRNILDGDVITDNRQIWIWGAGDTSELLMDSLKDGELNIEGFIDSDEKKCEEKFCGYNVILPKELSSMDSEQIIIAVSVSDLKVSSEIREGVKKYGDFLCVTVDELLFKANRNKIFEMYDLLFDETSKCTFVSLINSRVNGAELPDDIIVPKQYFAVNCFRSIKRNEVFVDCGAFVGDTLEDYIKEKSGTFSKIVAFEPNLKNFGAMKKRVERLIEEWALDEDKIVMCPYGVDEKSGIGYIEGSENGNSGTMMLSSGDGEKCECVALDEFLNEPVSFIKADIEGYERKMLKGAEKTIRKNKPKLAICIYHSPKDFFEIIHMIDNWNLGYKFSIRHHHINLLETVLYAWV